MSGRSTLTPRPTLSLGAAALGVGLAAAMGAAVSTTPTLVMTVILVTAALGVAGLGLMLTTTHGRVSDLLLLVAIVTVTIPIDKYFAIRDHVGGWPGLRLSVSDVAILALLPLGVLGVWMQRTRNAVPGAVLLLYACMLGQYCVSLLGASERDLALFEIASAAHALLLALVVGAMFRRELLRPVLALLALQALVHTAFAIAQVVLGRPVGAEWFQGASVVREALDNGAVRIRPSGLFDHPIVYADMLLLTLPMLFAGLFVPGGRLWRAGLVMVLFVGVAGLALTLSRGAWISTCVAGVALIAIARRFRLTTGRQSRRLLLGSALAALVLVPAFAPRAYERLVASNEGNLRVRFELNRIALSMMQTNPLTGVGVNNFIPVMDRYDPTNVMRYFPATVHNLYLLEGAEAGVPGLVLCVLLFGTVLATGFRGLGSIEDIGSRWVVAAILAGLTGFLVSQLADFSHRLEPLRSLIWMNIGLMFALVRHARKQAPELVGHEAR